MPGLIGGIARTAVVAGTATAVSNRVSRRQTERWAGQDAQQGDYQAPPQSAAPAAAPSSIDQLEKLGELRDKGVLTEEEFETQKAKLLAA
jgi:membrane protease subunit (stomatin/prohibitin family)